MPRKIDYKISSSSSKYTPLVRFFIIPISIIALLLVSIGIFTFINANKIMRQTPKALEDFANNVLPTYSIASFPSLDGVTYLSGWFFPTKQKPISTVIFVHDNGGNRLQFDVDTASLFEFFTDRGFNVFAFDLRHNGNSRGNLSTFGYAEWTDVVSAISYVRKNSVTKDVILYGFGSGGSACLMAMESLYDPTNPGSNEKPQNDNSPDFDKSYIRGLILDSPPLTSDDYIKAICKAKIFGGKLIGQYTIPYAVRLSAGANKNINLAAILARTQVPVHLVSKKAGNSLVDTGTDSLIAERIRLFPNLTTVYSISNITNLSTYSYDISSYQNAILDYLSRFIFS